MRILVTAAILATAVVPAAHAEQLWLTMDQVRPYKLETAAKSIVVGNPAIADVTIQDNNNILLFGKAPGLTNIYVFDENGAASQNLIIRVRTPSSDMLTVHRGAARTTYNCTTNCEVTVTIGDDAQSFQQASTQIENKYNQASNLGQGSGGEN